MCRSDVCRLLFFCCCCCCCLGFDRLFIVVAPIQPAKTISSTSIGDLRYQQRSFARQQMRERIESTLPPPPSKLQNCDFVPRHAGGVSACMREQQEQTARNNTITCASLINTYFVCSSPIFHCKGDLTLCCVQGRWVMRD